MVERQVCPHCHRPLLIRVRAHIEPAQDPALAVQLELPPRVIAKFKLTGRQARAAELVMQGLGNSEIAKLMGIQPQVVKNMLYAIFNKVGASNRTELAMMLHAQCVAVSPPENAR